MRRSVHSTSEYLLLRCPNCRSCLGKAQPMKLKTPWSLPAPPTAAGQIELLLLQFLKIHLGSNERKLRYFDIHH